MLEFCREAPERTVLSAASPAVTYVAAAYILPDEKSQRSSVVRRCTDDNDDDAGKRERYRSSLIRLNSQ